MSTPSMPHRYGDEVAAFLQSRIGWFTAGVATSVVWPKEDVWVTYDGVDFVLRGWIQGSKPSGPCVSTPCERDEQDTALKSIFRFCSVLGWYREGYVDIGVFVWSKSPIRYGDVRRVFADAPDGSSGEYWCGNLPLVQDEQVRKALAFIREGRRLRNVHEAFSFLCFFKVLESQLGSAARTAWIAESLDLLEGDAVKRVGELRQQAAVVSKYLFDSGRCAVAHATLGEAFVDPDIPADRRRVKSDLVVMQALAERYVKVVLAVPTIQNHFAQRNIN